MKKEELDPKEILRRKVVERRVEQNKQILNFLLRSGLNPLENVSATGEIIPPCSYTPRCCSRQHNTLTM